MKILIYQPRVYYYTGGGEVYPLQNAKFFAKLGHDVTLLTARADFLKESEYFKAFAKENKGVKIEYLELEPCFKDIYDEPAGMSQARWDRESLWVGRKAYEFLCHHKYDIVAVHYAIDALALPFGVRNVLHLHGAPSEISYLCQLVLERQKNFLAVSKNVVEKWTKFGVSPNTKVCTNAIDETFFYPDERVKRDIDLLFVGRLIEIKGIQYILESLQILKDRYNICPHLDIIGEGPYREVLVNLAKELKIEEQVNFRGLATKEVLRDAYQRAKVAVLPSFEKEGILSTLLEAGSCKTPAITTRGTSMEEFAKKDENALLVNPKDSIDLAEKIYKMLTDSTLASQIAENAYNEILKNYTWLNKTKQLARLYQEVE